MAKEPDKKTPRNGETGVDTIGNVGSDTRAREGEGVTTNEVDLEATREVPDKRRDKVSEKNAEGHEANMKAIEEAHKGNDGKPDPRLGREDNGNTPRIDAKGNKTWGPPGVAGAQR